MRPVWAVAVVALLVAGTSAAAGEVTLELPAEPFDRVAHARRESALHARLVGEQVAAGLDVPLSIELTATDRAGLTGPPLEGRLRVGVVKPLGVVVDFSDLPRGPMARVDRRRAVGAIRGTRDGGYVWTAVVESADARGLRLHLENFHLPEGAALWVYNAAGRARGPYTGGGPLGRNGFWTHTIAGSTLFLHLDVPGHARGARAPTFDIAEVGHLGVGFLLGTVPVPEAGSNLCAFNAACVENASCATIPVPIEDARDAVALIEFVSGAFLYVCSGGLIADTDVATEIPYFLTANHCLNREREADSAEAFFHFSTPCGGACVDPDGVVPSTLGSDLVATDKGTDFTLLRLNESAPSGSAFLGWTSTPVAFTNEVPLFRISHPGGAPQAYSEHIVDTSRPTCQSWPRGDRIYSSDLFGATEGGSSGSPVLNAAGQVVGQLSGACGLSVEDPCDAVNNATVDGAFAAYFSEVEPILDPSGPPSTTSTSTSSSTSSTTTSISTTVSTASSTSSSTSSTTTTSTSSSTSSTASTSSSTTTSVSPTVSTASSTSSTTVASTSTTTLSGDCSAAPVGGCRTPQEAVLAIKEQRVGRERLAFGARRFESGLPHDELGNPVDGNTAYRLCVYDATDRVVGRLAVDRAGQTCGAKQKACWKAIDAKGYAYRDRSSLADGVKRLVAIAGSVGKGSVGVKAGNAVRENRTSLPTGIATALEGNDRATVQLVTSDAGCVSVVLERVKKAEGSIFKATRP